MSVRDDNAIPYSTDSDNGFNPCFSGCRSAISPIVCSPYSLLSFNPCFSGCRSAIEYIVTVQKQRAEVSILVLVDVGPRY